MKDDKIGGKHLVVLTRRSEYHFIAQECVGVRDRQSAEWLHTHGALGARLRGSKPRADAPESQFWPGALRSGVCLVLEREGAEAHCTSSVLSLEYPEGERSRRLLEGLQCAGPQGPEEEPAPPADEKSVLDWLRIRRKVEASGS